MNPVLTLFDALSVLSVDPRTAMSRSFSLLHNKSYICLFLSQLFPFHLWIFGLPLFFFLPHKRRIFILLHRLTLSFLLPFAFSSPYFLSPPYVSFSTSRSRVKPSATTGPADEKEISSLSLSSFPFLLLPYSTFLSRLYSAIVRDSAKEQRCRQAGPELLS